MEMTYEQARAEAQIGVLVELIAAYGEQSDGELDMVLVSALRYRLSGPAELAWLITVAPDLLATAYEQVSDGILEAMDEMDVTSDSNLANYGDACRVEAADIRESLGGQSQNV